MLDWITGVAAWLSQGVNKIVLNGSPDMTVSARCYLNRNKPRWRTARKVINRVFFWQTDHCKSSFQSDVAFAVMVLTQNPVGQSECRTVGQEVVE